MEVSLLKAVGLPEGCILSVRAGSTRRQAHAEPNFKLAFPKSAQHADPFKVDALLPVGNAVINGITTETESLERVYNLDLGSSSGVNMHVSLMIRNLKSQPGALHGSPDAATFTGLLEKPETSASSSRRQQAAMSARQYLEQHQLLQWAQVLFQNLIREQPEDPWAFIEKSQRAQKNGNMEGSQPYADATEVQLAAEHAKAELSKKLETAMQEQADAKAEAKQAKAEIRELLAQLDAAKADVEAVAKQAKQEVSDLRAHLYAAKAEAEATTKNANEEASDLRAQLDAAKADAEATAKRAKEEASDLRAQLDAVKGDTEDVSTQAKEEVSDLRAQLDAAEVRPQTKAADDKHTTDGHPSSGPEHMVEFCRAMQIALSQAATDGSLATALESSGECNHDSSALRARVMEALIKAAQNGRLDTDVLEAQVSEKSPQRAKAAERKQHVCTVLVRATASGELAACLDVQRPDVISSTGRTRKAVVMALLNAASNGTLDTAVAQVEKSQHSRSTTEQSCQVAVQRMPAKAWPFLPSVGTFLELPSFARSADMHPRQPLEDVQAESATKIRQEVRQVLEAAVADGSLVDALSVSEQPATQAQEQHENSRKDLVPAGLRQHVRDVLIGASVDGSLANTLGVSEQPATELHDLAHTEMRQRARDVLIGASVDGSLADALGQPATESQDPVHNEMRQKVRDVLVGASVDGSLADALSVPKQSDSEAEATVAELRHQVREVFVGAAANGSLAKVIRSQEQLAAEMVTAESQQRIREVLNGASLDGSLTEAMSTMKKKSSETKAVKDEQPNSEQEWDLSFAVNNVDYSALLQRPQLLADFEATTKNVLAVEAGYGIQASDVQLLLSAGSVVVQAAFQLPNGISRDSVRSKLASSPSLQHQMISKLSSISGIREITVGPILVSEIQDMSRRLKEKWAQLPSVGTWSGMHRRQRQHATRNTPEKVKPSEPSEQYKLQWDLLPSVGTWAGLPPQQRVAQGEMEVPEHLCRLRWDLLPSVGTWAGLPQQNRVVQEGMQVPEQPSKLRWEFLPSVGTWAGLPLQKLAGEQAMEVPNQPRRLRWEFLPSVGTWAGLQQQKPIFHKKGEEPEQPCRLQWEFLPSVGTWAGLPRRKQIVQQKVEVPELPRWALLPSVGTWAGLQRVVRETHVVRKESNTPEQLQQLWADREAGVPEHPRQVWWELLPSVGTWTGPPQPGRLVHGRAELASTEFAPGEIHAAKLRCRRALSIVLSNQIGEEPLHAPGTSNKWDLCFKVHNLDYQALSQRAWLLAEFEAVTKEVLATEAGPDISADGIQLQLSAGSVVVQAAITPPEGVARTSVRSKLAVSPSLQQALISKVNGIDGIAEATTGPIWVTINSDSPESSLKLPPSRTQDQSIEEPPNVKAAPDNVSGEEDPEQWELLKLKALGALESCLIGEDPDAAVAEEESIRTKAWDAFEIALQDSDAPLAELDTLKTKALQVLESVSQQRYEELKEQAVTALEATLLSWGAEEEEEPPPLPTDMPAKMDLSFSSQADEVAVVKSAAPPAIKEASSVTEDHLRDLSERARQAKDDISLLHGEVRQELREVKEAAQGAKDDIINLRTVARQEHESAKHQLAEEERLARQRLEEFERRARERLEEANRTVQETKPQQASRSTTRSRPPSAAKEAAGGGDLGLRALELKLRQRNDKLRRGNDALLQENARLRKLRECSEAAAKLRGTNEKTRKELRQQLGSRRRSLGRSEAYEASSGKPGP